MVMFKKNRWIGMKKRDCCIFIYCLAALAFVSCVKDPVKAYEESDSAVYFLSPVYVSASVPNSSAMILCKDLL